MRAYPNLHPLIARRLGIRMIYAQSLWLPLHGHAHPSAGGPLHS